MHKSHAPRQQLTIQLKMQIIRTSYDSIKNDKDK